jgi:hypothetical protein
VQDPDGFARSLADRTGGTLVASAGEVASVIARRRMASVGNDPDGVGVEVAWLQGLLEGAPAELPPRLIGPGERTALLKALAERLGSAREEAKAARIALLKREAAVQAEVRKTTCALEVEPELARRVAHRVNVTLRQARAAQRALGPKPVLDKETEQQARRAMSRLEDALFASSKARARVHSRLAVGNVIGLVLVLVAAVAVWSGSDIDAPSVYTVFALAGMSPLAALAIGGVGAVHARRRVHSAHAACAEAFRKAGVDNADQLAGRRRELEEWLDRADATAAARDAWNEAKAAWEAMAGPGADPKAVDEMLDEGARLRAARAEAAMARTAADEALAAVAAAEDAVRDRLNELGPVATGAVVADDAPIVVAGSGQDRITIERLQPSLPVALVTGIDSPPEVRLYDEAAAEPRVDVAGSDEWAFQPATDSDTDERPTQAHSFVFDAESARRLRRRVRRRR